MTGYLKQLYQSLDERWRPEDVLSAIADGEPGAFAEIMAAPSPMWAVLSRRSHWSSMSSDFSRPVDGRRVLESVALACERDMIVNDVSDPLALQRVAEEFGAAISWHPSQEHGGRNTHLTRAERAEAGVELSRRKYNRQWRALRRLARKADRLQVETKKREFDLIGRSGFAHQITYARFVGDPAAAHFIAYWAARKNMRRTFSLSGKVNPMDTVARSLLNRCEQNDDTDWDMIAQTYPHRNVLARLSDTQRGMLLGKWYNTLRESADMLSRIWDPATNRETMIVRRGLDSSTWNTVAQAYNAARSAWLNCITAVGAEQLLDAACPGKVMRLMAADLAYWHQSTGGDAVDVNTKIWARLPFPWEVLSGDVICTREMVEGVCCTVHVDPQQSGWTAPKPDGKPVSFTLTPELVHGVTIADPAWAQLLRNAGVFSGKKITRDSEHAQAAYGGLLKGVVVSDLPESRVDKTTGT
jgi:hypothetical protein